MSLVVLLDIGSVLLLVIAIMLLRREEKYEDPGVIPFMVLFMYGLFFIGLYVLSGLLEYGGMNGILEEAQIIFLPMGAMCLFISAHQLRQLSKVLSFVKK